MKRAWILPLAVVSLAIGCGGKKIDQQVRQSVRQLDGWTIPDKDIEVVEIQESGDTALAEVKIKTALKLRRGTGGWTVEEIRLGDRRWERAEHLLALLNEERSRTTRGQLERLRESLLRYRQQNGAFPQSEDFETLVDVLAPRFLHPIIRLDAWSNAFSYQPGGSGYDLRSAGPDGEFRTADDLVSGDGQ